MMFLYAAKLYRDYLDDRLDDDVRVAGDVPVDRPPRLVTVAMAPASGTAKPRVFSWRRLIFQCWDSQNLAAEESNEIAAFMLCEQVRDLVVESVYAHIGVRRVNVIGEPARWDDPEIAASRFQTTIDVLLRANR